MANLVLGNNIYKDIEYVKIHKEDGTIATFVESKSRSDKSFRAYVSYTKGQAYAVSASVNLGTITTSVDCVVEQ